MCVPCGRVAPTYKCFCLDAGHRCHVRTKRNNSHARHMHGIAASDSLRVCGRNLDEFVFLPGQEQRIMVPLQLDSQLRNYLQDELRVSYDLVMRHLHQQGWRSDM